MLGTDARMMADFWTKVISVFVVTTHAGLLAWSAFWHSPTFNELPHVPAGLSHWQYRMFHLYRVNPPLARMVATLPLLWCRPKTDWTNYGMGDFSREEAPMGIRFVKANGPDTFRLLTIARWACIPFSLLGALVCYRWATELWRPRAGLTALSLWCFDPMILGHAPLVMPDVPAAATGIAAAYVFWKWLRDPTWTGAFIAGSVLGTALLCKTTLLIFTMLFPMAWLTTRLCGASPWRDWFREAAMLGAALFAAVYVVNLGYAFSGSFQPVGSLRFQSRLLGGNPVRIPPVIGNRLATPLFANFPVPVPRDYLLGIDQQRTDFEKGDRCYLRGEWKEGGWWYFYLYGLLVKLPLATIGLFGLACALACRQLFGPRRLAETGHRAEAIDEILLPANKDIRAAGSPVGAACIGGSSRWIGDLCLVSPAVGILVLVSSQTNYTNHLRYVLPACPFLFVWISRVGALFTRRTPLLGALAAVLLTWSTASSLTAYPHNVSYFNELVGGPANGHEHLVDSNAAWGQDLLYLKRWLDGHPEARPIGLATIGWIDPRLAGIESTLPPVGSNRIDDTQADVDPRRLGPLPGWFVIDANFLHGTHWPTTAGEGTWQKFPARGEGPNFEYFTKFQPIDRVGYSMFVYHITREEANGVRAKLGLPPLEMP